MYATLGLNHYKYSVKEGFLQPKYYNMRLGLKPEPITVFSLSAKDFFMEMGRRTSQSKKIQRKWNIERHLTQGIKPEKTFFEEERTLPIMKPFTSKPLRIINLKTSNPRRKTQNEGLFIVRNSNGKESTNQENIVHHTIENKMNNTMTIKSKAYQRPFTCKNARENKSILSVSKGKKSGYPFELKGLVKVGEVYDLLRLGKYERIKRKEEIDGILDMPAQEVFIQRPYSSDHLLKFSQQTSLKTGLENFMNKRAFAF